MATPAATLQIMVDANTASATTALSRFDSKLRGVDKTTATATTRTSALGSASRTAGSRLRSAAGYAASAAAAYLSISQAKAAVTTTQDLAKTTAGLNRNLGLTVERGSQWAAIAKSRDIDPKALTMSFTTLSRNLVDARRGSETALRSFQNLGIGQKELQQQNFNETLMGLADAFGEAEGGAKRQTTAQKLLGRGYQTLLPMFADGSKGLKEQFGWAQKYGAELDENTLDKQMKLTMALRESKVAWLGLQVTFTKAITPALKVANREFQKISEIMANKELTDAEKFEKVGRIIGKWADKAFDAFVKILPKLVEKAAEAAPRIAGALVKGFLNSDIWARLAIGGWLLAKLGGSAAVVAIGRTVGTKFGKGFSSGIVLGAILFGPELLKAAYDFGKKVGHVIKDAIKASGAADLVKQALNIDKVQPEDVNVGKALAAGNITIDKAAKMLKHRGETAKHTEKVIQKALGLSERNIQEHGEIVEYTAKKSSANWSGFGEKLVRVAREMSRKGRHEVDELSGGVVDDLGWAAEKGTEKSGDLRRGVGGNFKGLAGTIRRGLENIKENTNKSLGAFGADKLKFQLKVAKEVGGFFGQRGGPIDQGKASGDSVPAMLERGEYVLNRNAVKGIGKDRLDAVNFGAAKRFATGGWVDPAGPGTGVVNPAIAKVVGQWSQRYQAAINYGFDPGGGHVSPGHNVTGTATDTGPAAGWTPSATSLFEKGLRALEGKVSQILYGTAGIGTAYPNHGRGNHAHIEWGMHPEGGFGALASVARVLLQGPDGPLKDMGQGALDKARKAANKFLSRKMGSIGGGDLGAMTAGGQFGKSELMKLWSGTGGNGNSSLMAAIALAESGGNPSVTNSIGARGLWQIMPYTAADYGFNYGRMTDPTMNAKAAHAILAGQGLGAWEAYTNGAYQQFMQKGGEALPYLGQFHKGGPVLQDGLLHAQKGEFVMPSVEHRRHELRHAARAMRELEKQMEKRQDRISEILSKARSTDNEHLEQRLRARVDDLRGASADDRQANRALTRQVELLEALLEQTKSAEAEARERYRTERQAMGTFRATGQRVLADLITGEIGSAFNRTRGWAGRGQLTETGRR